ncbi:hypothetical protein AAD001_07605 [Colwelliaceae bacterium 6471]
MKITWIVLLSFISFLSVADWTEQGIYAKCSDGFKLEIGSYNVTNGNPSANTLGIFPYLSKNEQEFIFMDNDEHEINCKLADKSINVIFKLNQPSARGACGAAPGGKISLTIDGVTIFKNTSINNGCYESIEKITISTFASKAENLRYEFCGNGKTTNFSVRGCIELNNDNFSKVKLPLSIFPISNLLSQTPF